MFLKQNRSENLDGPGVRTTTAPSQNLTQSKKSIQLLSH